MFSSAQRTGETDRQTDGQTDRQTDGRRTDLLWGVGGGGGAAVTRKSAYVGEIITAARRSATADKTD